MKRLVRRDELARLEVSLNSNEEKGEKGRHQKEQSIADPEQTSQSYLEIQNL